MESFYPPNVHWYTSFYIGKISKSLTNEFNSVNDEILWNPISQIGKIIAFTTNMYFYPKNVLVGMITGVWKSKNSNIFILNSVNGGQSFLSKTNYDFFYSKLHPNRYFYYQVHTMSSGFDPNLHQLLINHVASLRNESALRRTIKPRKHFSRSHQGSRHCWHPGWIKFNVSGGCQLRLRKIFRGLQK